MTWSLLLDPPAAGAWNMALDHALLSAAEGHGLACLRLYAWDPPCLSFGRNEPALRRYDRAALERRGLAAVRRPTGGRAVWHHREVTYAVAAPATTFGSLPDTYREIHALIADALRALGADVRLADDRGAGGVGAGAGACFATAAGGEVVAEAGGKVVGSAQLRGDGAFLQHGSILLAAEQDLVASLTLGPTGAPAAPAATGLAELVYPRRATWSAVSAAVAEAAVSRWGVPESPGPLPAGIRARAEALLPRYTRPEWTWRR